MKPDLSGVELHTHLEGAVTPNRLIALAEKHGQPSLPESCLNPDGTAYVFQGFDGFLDLFRKVTLLLKTPADFHEVALDLGRALFEDGIGYAEVSLSYGVMLKRGLAPLAIQQALFEAACQVEETHGVVMRWLPDAVRQWGPDPGWRAFEAAARAGRELGVVGFGLGGDEASGPAADFAPLFADVRGEGLGISIHAGEIPAMGTAAAESIRQAVEECGAQRIGHGLAASGNPLVLALLKARNIFVELCPGSNLCTGNLEQVADHPLQEFLAAEIPCGLNPDDRSLFGLDAQGELSTAREHLGLQENQIKMMEQWARQAVFDPSVFEQKRTDS
jgi:aminodeoxyfutalosine deaminase